MLALFVMIVLMLLGTALVNVLMTSSESIAQEVIGTRALAAANSGAQGELQKLFPLNGGGTYCNVGTVSNDYTDFSDVSGLMHCEATTTCERYAFDSKTSISYYRVTSIGKCGSGSMDADSLDTVLSSRKVQIEARSL